MTKRSEDQEVKGIFSVGGLGGKKSGVRYNIHAV